MKRSLVVEDSFHCPDNITSYISFPLFHFSFLSFLLLFFLSKFLWKYNVYRKVCCCLVVKSCSTLCNLPGSSVCGILQARILEWFAFPSAGDLPYPGIEPTLLVSSALAGELCHLGSLYFLISLLLNFIRRENVGSLFGN